MSRSDQIGLDEIKRRVDAAISDTLTEQSDPPADGKWPIREMARLVEPRLDQDVLKAIEREGLIRFVRRVMRTRNAQRNKAKQAKPRQKGNQT